MQRVEGWTEGDARGGEGGQRSCGSEREEGERPRMEAEFKFRSAPAPAEAAVTPRPAVCRCLFPPNPPARHSILRIRWCCTSPPMRVRLSAKAKVAARTKQFIASIEDDEDDDGSGSASAASASASGSAAASDRDADASSSGGPKPQATFEATWLAGVLPGGCAQCFFLFLCLYIS